MPRVTLYKSSIAAFIAAAIACGGLFAGGYFYIQSRDAYSALLRLQRLYLGQGASLYGFVKETDPAQRTVTVVVRSRFNPETTYEVVITITDDTTLGRQDLVKDGDAYISATPLTPTTIETIRPGERATVRAVQRQPDGHINAGIIVIGNTL